MDAATDQYLALDSEGKATQESVEHAFKKVGGICRVERASKDDPDLKRLYYIRGILRNRLSYCRDAEALQWLRVARSWEVSLNELEEMSLRVRTWTQFGDAIDELVARQKVRLGEDSAPES